MKTLLVALFSTYLILAAVNAEWSSSFEDTNSFIERNYDDYKTAKKYVVRFFSKSLHKVQNISRKLSFFR